MQEQQKNISKCTCRLFFQSWNLSLRISEKLCKNLVSFSWTQSCVLWDKCLVTPLWHLW